MIYTLIFSIVIIFSLLFIFYPPLSSNFLTWTDKATVIQTIFTIAASIVAIIGIGEYIKKTKRKIKPVFLVYNSEEYTFLSNSYPLKIEIPFSVKNKGSLTIEKERVYYLLLAPKELDITPTSGATYYSAMLSPEKNVYSDTRYNCLGAIIPSLITPNRQLTVFNATLNVEKPGTYKLKYYFNSDDGFYPNGIKVNELNEPVEGLGEITLHFTKTHEKK